MDVDKHVAYWKNGSEEDITAARSLLEKGHLRHCLFFVHLAIEKILKAHVTRLTKDVPPRIHNLVRLADMAGLKLESGQRELLREFGAYQLEGWYPDSEQVPKDPVDARREMERGSQILTWLTKQL
jgi:HEPN domain-containing protein